MISKYEELSPVKREMQVTVPAEEVTAEIVKVCHEFARQVRIPGFRKGKAPATMIKQRYWKDVEHEVAKHLLPRHWRAAIAEKQLVPVAEPAIDAIAIVEGQPLTFNARFEVRPSFALAAYKELRLTARSSEPDAAEIEATLERLRDNAATFVNVEGRGVADGDYALVDLVGQPRDPGVEELRWEKKLTLAGSADNPDGLNAALTGLEPGGEARFMATLPASAAPEAAGKSFDFTLRLHEIKEKIMPELNAEFLRSLGEFETLEELRADLAANLRRRKERERHESLRRQAGDALEKQHAFEVPEVLVGTEAESMLREYARSLAHAGVDIEKAPIDWGEVRDKIAPRAAGHVRQDLILDAIADAEDIQVSGTDLELEIGRLAAAAQIAAGTFKRRLEEHGGIEELKASLRRHRAREFVIANAVIVEESA